jgi:hypothetical protein
MRGGPPRDDPYAERRRRAARFGHRRRDDVNIGWVGSGTECPRVYNVAPRPDRPLGATNCTNGVLNVERIAPDRGRATFCTGDCAAGHAPITGGSRSPVSLRIAAVNAP